MKNYLILLSCKLFNIDDTMKLFISVYGKNNFYAKQVESLKKRQSSLIVFGMGKLFDIKECVVLKFELSKNPGL